MQSYLECSTRRELLCIDWVCGLFFADKPFPVIISIYYFNIPTNGRDTAISETSQMGSNPKITRLRATVFGALMNKDQDCLNEG